MNREKLEEYISLKYNTDAEYPWESDPAHAVFRHKHNRKWFALIMKIDSQKIGLSGGNINVINLKCDPMLIGSLVLEDGIHPAYHMNKNHWITVRLDGSINEDKIHWLLDLSFELTAKKKR